jgi:hypothetical protein
VPDGTQEILGGCQILPSNGYILSKSHEKLAAALPAMGHKKCVRASLLAPISAANFDPGERPKKLPMGPVS